MVGVRDGVGICVGVGEGVLVGVWVEVGVRVGVGVIVGVRDGVGVWVDVGVDVGVGVAKNAAMISGGWSPINTTAPHSNKPPANKNVSSKQPVQEKGDGDPLKKGLERRARFIFLKDEG
jgi:hypothetical protein